MKNFEELEEETIEEYTLPLGISSNIQNRLGNMRTFGSVIELYLSKILDMLTSMLGGETNTKANTHLLTLLVHSSSNEINEKEFIEKLTAAFNLAKEPTIIWVLPNSELQKIEVSIKLPARDAKKVTNSVHKDKLERLGIEVH